MHGMGRRNWRKWVMVYHENDNFTQAKITFRSFFKTEPGYTNPLTKCVGNNHMLIQVWQQTKNRVVEIRKYF